MEVCGVCGEGEGGDKGEERSVWMWEWVFEVREGGWMRISVWRGRRMDVRSGGRHMNAGRVLQGMSEGGGLQGSDNVEDGAKSRTRKMRKAEA